METPRTIRDTPVAPEAIDALAAAIARRIEPVCVVLFGSYAAGTPHAESDVDLLVVTETDRPRGKRREPLYDLVRDAPRWVDLKIYTPAEVRYWLGTTNHIITAAFETGTPLYGRPAAEDFQKDAQTMSTHDDELAQEFMRKARSDLFAARKLVEADGPTDTPAFHTQQATEKALKALLTARGIDAPRTHNLLQLLDLFPEKAPTLEMLRGDLDKMSAYGVSIRYPLMPDPERKDVQRALEVAEQTVRVVEERLSENDD